jgi:polyphosphate kinase
VREEQDGMRRYCHIGTGNYNPKTARLYEDIGLLTCDPLIGADLTQLFNFLTGYARDVVYNKLLVAPNDLRPRLTALIENEIVASPGERRLVFKMNSLVDPELIDLLYRASQSGVSIDLIIRGICCLRPGVPGLSDNIRVRSIIGRYLEHARIFRFAHGGPDGGPIHYIGSADLMPRNLDRRVDIELADDTLAWTLGADGSWHKDGTPGVVDSHCRLQEVALAQRLPS